MVISKGLCNINYGNLLTSNFRRNGVNFFQEHGYKNIVPFYIQQRGYAMRLELTEYGILWKRPEAIPSWMPEKSGDLLSLEYIDKSKPVVSLKCIEKEIEKADKRVQDLLSIGFSSGKAILAAAKLQLSRKVQRHQFDNSSPEVKIAMKTAEIRYFQQIVPKHPDNVRMRVRLQETIDNRNKRLRRLRQSDIKRFEWLLEELQIIFRPLPRDPEPVTRKGSLKKLVDMHCEKIISAKLEKYKYELEAQQKPFLQEKFETLKWIAETEAILGLPVSVQGLSSDPALLYLSDDKTDTKEEGVDIHINKTDASSDSIPEMPNNNNSSHTKNCPES